MADYIEEDKKKALEGQWAELKSRLKNVSTQTQADTFLAEAGGLAIEAKAYGLDFDIASVKEAVDAKVKNYNVDIAVDRDIAATEKAQSEPEAKEYDAEKMHEEIHKEHERLKVQHKEFLEDADKYIDERKKENELLKSLNADLEAGKEIDEEKLKKLIKTPAQIKEQHEKLTKLNKHKEEADKNHAAAVVHDEELKKERAKIAQELEEKRKAIKDLPPAEQEKEALKLKPLEKKFEQQDTKVENFQPILHETAVIKNETNSKIEEVNNNKTERDTQFATLKERLAKLKEVDPKKHEKLNETVNLIEAQEKAIITGEIKDTEQRNKFLDKENNSQLENKVNPPEKTTSVEKEPYINPTTTPAPDEQQTLFKKIIHTIGDTILKLKEKFNLQPIPENELTNAKQQLRASLENQNSISPKNKENQVNKQLNRTNQQNKSLTNKNKEHIR
nr:hypothetical protein [Rickettsia endosymbiont of Ceutorhynchus assimilis]